MKDLIVGLEQMGALESMSSDELDAAIRAFITSFSSHHSTSIDVVAFIRCIRGNTAASREKADFNEPFQANDNANVE